MAPNPLVVGAPSYGALEHTGRMRCGPYVGEERNLPEVASRHGAAPRLVPADKGGNIGRAPYWPQSQMC